MLLFVFTSVFNVIVLEKTTFYEITLIFLI